MLHWTFGVHISSSFIWQIKFWKEFWFDTVVLFCLLYLPLSRACFMFQFLHWPISFSLLSTFILCFYCIISFWRAVFYCCFIFPTGMLRHFVLLSRHSYFIVSESQFSLISFKLISLSTFVLTALSSTNFAKVELIELQSSVSSAYSPNRLSFHQASWHFKQENIMKNQTTTEKALNDFVACW